MAYISSINTVEGNTFDIRSKMTNGILYGEVDSTSTSTVYTASIPGVTSYYEGLTIMLRNGEITSAAGFTVNINGLGAKKVYNNMATGNDRADPPTTATQDTTIFNVAYTMLFVYVSALDSGNGGWICYRGYDANTNTIGYQVRTNSCTLPMSDKVYRYRIMFTSADNTHFVPSNASTSTNATAKRDVCQTKINPFGRIVYMSASGNYAAGANPAATVLWDQYAITLGYSFNRTDAALVLTYPAPVYVKCAPQSDGSAIIDATTPYVQTLPSTADGKIYIFLGIAYSATNIELLLEHPVYYYADGAIRLWTNPVSTGSSVDPATATPLMDGTGAVGSSAKYAREDHVHPSDTNKQATLVSGTNIKTVNSTSLLGSGDVAVQPTLVSGTNIKTVNSTSLLGSGDIAVQPTLVSGTNIKTVNNTSLLGSGDVAVQPTLVSGTNIKTVNSTSLLGSGDVAVQPTLVSGTNIKTINNESILGSGNLDIGGLPTVTASDNGKFLRVVNGEWAADAVPSANGVSF